MSRPALSPDLHARVADALGDPYVTVLNAHPVLSMPEPRPGAQSWPVPSIKARVETSDGRCVIVVLEQW
jgi:hypothetical protein